MAHISVTFLLTPSEWVMAALTTAYVIFTGAYVIISHNTLAAIERQADITEKQAESSVEQIEIARKAAEAARTSAESLMNSERAWLIVRVEFAPGSSGPFLTTSVENNVISRDTALVVRLSITNQGRTPAWIDEVRVGSQLLESLDSLPAVPDFSSASEIQSQLEPVGMRDEVKREFTVIAKGHSVSLGTETLVYGAVAYRDVFGCRRQTRFTYLLATKGAFVRLAGFPEYNAHL